ncbi:MAG TPA: decarboxylating 6-phosphogluconate dehydrogenase [Armatimonadota bacterium]|jgi:6-phosphogluconate dehydrogenase
MQIAMVGLGRMGLNMARRLLRSGHQVVAYNRTYAKTEELIAEGATGVRELAELVTQMTAPRAVWLMLPEGQPTEDHLRALTELLEPGDLLVDGGNTYFRDDLRRAEAVQARGLHYMDAGVSGGVWGLEEGYCLMLGGADEDFARLAPALRDLAPPDGYLHCGPVGAGHFVKMVHNGIEYAMMEAYGEGLEILRASQFGAELDLPAVAHLWNQGSVVRSWLLELLEHALAEDPGLEKVAGYVEDSGEGRWTVLEAVQSGVAAEGIAHAVFKRFLSRQSDAFSNKVLAALRLQFGGHATVAPEAAPRGSEAGAGEVSAAHAAPGSRK